MDWNPSVTVIAALVGALGGVIIGVLVAGYFGRARLADRERNYQENLARLNELVADAERRFTTAFESLGAKILDEKTAKFTEINRARLDELLAPFRERLKELQKKVEDTHITDVAERGALRMQLETLRQLNQQIALEHGLEAAMDAKHSHQDKPFRIVGILQRTGTAVDRTGPRQFGWYRRDACRLGRWAPP